MALAFRSSGLSRGQAFIKFVDSSAADAAIDAASGSRPKAQQNVVRGIMNKSAASAQLGECGPHPILFDDSECAQKCHCFGTVSQFSCMRRLFIVSHMIKNV